MKIVKEDTEKELTFDIEVYATKAEIENAIKMLTELLADEMMPSEVIFVKFNPLQVLGVSKLD